jgi:4-amino-4-deoxy-L-arabinose transferase-like glycosyltransferase
LSSQRRIDLIAITALLLLACSLRMLVVWKMSDQLVIDLDNYLAIAESLYQGNGFSEPDDGKPTAFRPPGYPLMLAAMKAVASGGTVVGFPNVVFGTATVWLTFCIGIRLGHRKLSFLAASLVAIDPLLLRYTALPMTEVTLAFLVSLLLWLRQSDGHSSWQRQLLFGVVLGICILWRPTIWAFVVLLMIWWCVTRLKSKSNQAAEQGYKRQIPWITIIGLVLTIAPWGIRNQVLFRRPIVTTTHGGYTLLLGNNSVFYAEVVDQPWGTVWNGDSLNRWQRSLKEELQSSFPHTVSEVERDRWYYRKALQHMKAQPGMAFKACLLRFARFWNVVPIGPSRDSLPPWVIGSIAGYYTLLIQLLIVGVIRSRVALNRWMPLLLLLVAFSSVHFVFWSNMRMRAPIVPVIALLAAQSFCSRPKTEYNP